MLHLLISNRSVQALSVYLPEPLLLCHVYFLPLTILCYQCFFFCPSCFPPPHLTALPLSYIDTFSPKTELSKPTTLSPLIVYPLGEIGPII